MAVKKIENQKNAEKSQPTVDIVDIFENKEKNHSYCVATPTSHVSNQSDHIKPISTFIR